MKNYEQLAGKLSQVGGNVSNSSIVKTVTGGTMAAFPAIMSGSISTILNAIPIPAYQNFLKVTGINNIFNIIIMCTTNLIALFIAFGIAYTYVKEKGQDAKTAGILSLVSFLIMTPFTAAPTEYGTVDYSIPTAWLGGSGMFSAIIVGFIVGIMFVFIKKKGWTIKLPDTVPLAISSSFAGIIPGVLILGFFGIISEIFAKTSFGSFHQAIYTLLQTPLRGLGTNIWAVAIIVIFSQALWILGIHGPMLVIPIVAVVWMTADYANLAAYNAGGTPQNITGIAFYLVYTFAGGGLGLAINMMFAKSKRYKELGKLAIVPSAFGVTEPLLFGTPIVMNFKMAIPHIFVPTISILLAYALTKVGILPCVSGVGVPTGTPIVMMGLLEGSWKIGVFQGLLVILWIICYFPFFRSLDKEAFNEEQKPVQE